LTGQLAEVAETALFHDELGSVSVSMSIRDPGSCLNTTSKQWGGDYEHRFRVLTNKIRNHIRKLKP
jgi:hypothetical protein